MDEPENMQIFLQQIFSEKEINEYMGLGRGLNRCLYLDRKRNSILKKIHILEEQIFRLDFLRYQMKEEKK